MPDNIDKAPGNGGAKQHVKQPPASLRTKLLLFATALVVAPGVLFAIIAYSRSSDSLDHVIGRHLASEAGNTADGVVAALGAARDIVRRASRQHLMREVRVGDIDKRVSAFLTTLKQGTPECLDFLVVDGTGRVIAASQPSILGDLQEWGQAAATALTGSEVLLAPVLSPLHGRSAVQIAAPVHDPDTPGRIIGGLLGIYDWKGVTGAIDDTHDKLRTLGLGTDVLIVNAQGTVIRGVVREDSSIREGERLRDVGWPKLDRMQSESKSGVFAATGPRFLVGHARLETDLVDWRIVVSQPLDEALAPVRQMARQLVLALAVTLAVALLMAAAGAGRVIRPLSKLTRAIRDLSRGQGEPEPVDVDSNDEVGTLSDAFNLMSAELHQAQLELVEAAKFAFVGELAAGVAHEVRTPLGALKSSAQILERSLHADHDRQAVELAGIIRGEVDRVDRVVDGLLNLARPRDLQLEPVLLAETVFRAADFVEPQAREKGITIARTGADGGAVARCDRELIYQVALNLMVNAIQILPDDGTIDIAIFAGGDSMVGFEVRDNGPGIPEELRSRVFLPFESRREGGTGLGLTFVQRVVQEHRGRVRVESEVGLGTCFCVELPAVRKFG